MTAGAHRAADRRQLRILVLMFLLAAGAVLLPGRGAPASASASGDLGAVTVTKKISRVHLVNGHDVVADHRTVTLKVDQTNSLRDREAIEVTWSGAHPTGNPATDPNSPAGADDEYPMVLMECRGIDSANASKADRLTPETCWSQSPTERYVENQLAFPPWRVDRYASVADRGFQVGVPKPLPKACFPSFYPQHWLHFRAADGTDYRGGPQNGCAGIAPEQTVLASTDGLPGNTTYGATDPDGTGQAKFDVWTSITNVSLGCGPSVPCSLVAVPVEGISCDVAADGLPKVDRPTGDDATAAETACMSDGGSTVPSLAVAGRLWWSESNWRNRITIPLHFAPLPSASCGGTNSKPAVSVYGSELMTAATEQWSSKLCGDPKLVPVNHVQTGETQARNLLMTHNTDAAFTSAAPDGGYGSPIVSAPVGMTGFAIGYAVDDADGHEYTKLRLTPRLLAKLLTESYPTILDIKDDWAKPPVAGATDYRALENNPLNISQDPEFIALNPGISHDVANTFGASTLLMLSSDSDVVRALTSYIDADPEARAWLDGTPDPWGMVVNPNYRGIALPVDSWPLLDSFEPTEIYNETNVCLQDNPVPYLPLVASPMTRLSLLSQDLRYAIQQSQVVCTGAGTSNPKLSAVGRLAIGSRFIIGVTSLADARRYRIDTAALQTRVASDAPTQFSDATGRTFVAPTDDSLRAAAKLLTPDDKTGTWTLPYDRFVRAGGSTSAYPGAMLISMAVRTSGLPADEASGYSSFLKFAAGDGQQPGTGSGELPAGFLPLIGPNGLGAEQRYAQIAAEYIAAQNGTVPNLENPKPLPNQAPTPSGTSTGSGPSSLPSPGTSGPGGNQPAGSSGPSASGRNSASGSAPAPATNPSTSNAANTLTTPAVRVGVIGTLLPILALLGLGSAVAVPAMGRVRGRRS